jgi:hypothetical protein
MNGDGTLGLSLNLDRSASGAERNLLTRRALVRL